MTTLTSQQSWVDYFVRNRDQLLDIAWMDSYELTVAERAAITKSVQQFQLGEQSDGKRFIFLAERYIARTGDTDYLEALHLFIAEEQRHSRDLARFMHQQHIPCIESHPVDSVFRWLRRLFNLELEIVVLLSAEVIACTFYKALYDATESKTLRDLCRQILRDEVQHLKFQSGTLRKIRGRRSRLGRWLTQCGERLFFAVVLIVVWHGHRAVYRAGGFSFRKFWLANWNRHSRTFT
ncbi:MAG: ferritin-like domain-containing protein [Chloroflexi bacterium]|nr:ferritin-like domain-containing protein [Chloroflexota bacterium]